MYLNNVFKIIFLLFNLWSRNFQICFQVTKFKVQDLTLKRTSKVTPPPPPLFFSVFLYFGKISPLLEGLGCALQDKVYIMGCGAAGDGLFVYIIFIAFYFILYFSLT